MKLNLSTRNVYTRIDYSRISIVDITGAGGGRGIIFLNLERKKKKKFH